MTNQWFWDDLLERIKRAKSSGIPYVIVRDHKDFFLKSLDEGRITKETYQRFENIIKK